MSYDTIYFQCISFQGEELSIVFYHDRGNKYQEKSLLKRI